MKRTQRVCEKAAEGRNHHHMIHRKRMDDAFGLQEEEEYVHCVLAFSGGLRSSAQMFCSREHRTRKRERERETEKASTNNNNTVAKAKFC